MRFEICLSTFDADWNDLCDAATLADRLGIGGIWVMDHLSGAVHERHHVLEALSVVGGVIGATERCRVGTLVLNAATRHPSVVAQAAATQQLQSGGRFVCGIGAGGGSGTPYAEEMIAAGFDDESPALRRERLGDVLGVLRALWTDTAGAGYDGRLHRVGPTEGFLRPDPAPPILVAGFGPKVATLAGQFADAFNTHASADLDHLFAAADTAAAATGRGALERTVFDDYSDAWLDPANPSRQRVEAAGTDTTILVLIPPFDHAVIASIAAIGAA